MRQLDGLRMAPGHWQADHRKDQDLIKSLEFLAPATHSFKKGERQKIEVVINPVY